MVTTLVIASILLGATPSAPRKGFPDLFEACNAIYRTSNSRRSPLRITFLCLVIWGRRSTVHCWSGRSLGIGLIWCSMTWITSRSIASLFWWSSSHEGFDHILREIVSKYPVDQNRVYLAGASRGGWVCWEIAMSYPELIAAVAPMGAGRS